MSTAAQAPALRSVPRVTFGVVLFVAWGIETFFWVYATIHSAADGEVMPVVTAVAALALLVLLAGMEGLEVAVIDRWRSLYPQRTTSDLAACPTLPAITGRVKARAANEREFRHTDAPVRRAAI